MSQQNNQITCKGNDLQEQILTPFQRKLLQKSLQEDLPNQYRQRIQIMLLADQGKSQVEICQTLRCCAATVRHWTHIARTGMAHQWQDCPIGRPKTVNEVYSERLKELISHSPRDYGYCFRRWTVNWLSKHLAKELGIEVGDRQIKRLLKQMGLSTIPKQNQISQATTEKTKSSKILIHDLKSENIADDKGFLPINLETLGRELNIHGGKSIRAVSFVTTVEQLFGLLSGGTRMERILPRI
ncbi:helix-turn-helix domain-containing protein [Nostoc sp. UCD121]|uniref:helix-turn-helix domain-containing protein n=1 Tax=unclassified Nostoc TaxID=2593658 RepID=UPI001625547C|nr:MULTISPECIES: helix-turn-helix domain-containing protein [unclassified Nostoc]MBC1225296.1 helix-turn-helix domain-containing protein [Nostoc sp. UCD120]MBC1278364.1 helix-turn-helix domain-containing protein [Nostoc sp. UCD121]